MTYVEYIESVRQPLGESLAEYLRRAAEQRLEREHKRKLNLASIADRVVGAGSSGFTSRKAVMKWQQEMRKDKKE